MPQGVLSLLGMLLTIGVVLVLASMILPYIG